MALIENWSNKIEGGERGSYLALGTALHVAAVHSGQINRIAPACTSACSDFCNRTAKLAKFSSVDIIPLQLHYCLQ